MITKLKNRIKCVRLFYRPWMFAVDVMIIIGIVMIIIKLK